MSIFQKSSFRSVFALAVVSTFLVGCGSRIEVMKFIGENVGKVNCDTMAIFLYKGHEGALDANKWYTTEEADETMLERTDTFTAAMSKAVTSSLSESACN